MRSRWDCSFALKHSGGAVDKTRRVAGLPKPHMPVIGGIFFRLGKHRLDAFCFSKEYGGEGGQIFRIME